MADALDWLQDILSGKTGPLPDLINQQSFARSVMGRGNYMPGASFRQNALNPDALQQAMDVAMGVSGGGLGTKRSAPLYHVAGPEWRPGEPLHNLVARHGEEAAADIYANRWPDAGDLVMEHPYNTFFYDTRNAAKEHVDEYGGRILQVDRDRITSLYKNLSEEPGFWATQYDVPADALKAVLPKGVSFEKWRKGLLD